MATIKEQTEYLLRRVEQLEEENEEQITTFVEITLKKEDLEIMYGPMFGWDSADELFEYYKGKIDKSITLLNTPCTTREDVNDFQYLVNLGLQALKQGLIL